MHWTILIFPSSYFVCPGTRTIRTNDYFIFIANTFVTSSFAFCDIFGEVFTEEEYKFFRWANPGILKSYIMLNLTAFCDNEKLGRWIICPGRKFLSIHYNIRIKRGHYFFDIVGFPASIFRFITVVRSIWLVISKLLDMIFFSLKGPIMASSTWHKKFLAAVERTWQPALYIALTFSESWLSLNFWIFPIASFTVFSSKFWFIFSTWCNDSKSFL